MRRRLTCCSPCPGQLRIYIYRITHKLTGSHRLSASHGWLVDAGSRPRVAGGRAEEAGAGAQGQEYGGSGQALHHASRRGRTAQGPSVVGTVQRRRGERPAHLHGHQFVRMGPGKSILHRLFCSALFKYSHKRHHPDPVAASFSLR